MNIVFIEPFLGVSHKKWALELKKHSTHKITILSLEGRHWKWRMHGGAIELAKQFLSLTEPCDLIMATDMLDLTTFLALTREKTAYIPTLLYFHENQLTYPWSADDHDVPLNRDIHYGFMNYTSALTANACWFNSKYNMDSFLKAAHKMLSKFPDYRGLDTVSSIAAKSHVMPLGMELSYFDTYSTNTLQKTPVILWNHRWEYDKNPEDFFNLLFQLKQENIDFQLIVVGESFKKYPKIFDIARDTLRDNLLHFGYATTREEYARLLNASDLLPVTSYQDFFGISIMEAAYCKVVPLLPQRLTYPDLFNIVDNKSLFYTTNEDLKAKITDYLRHPNKLEQHKKRANHIASRYNWAELINLYDQGLLSILKASNL
jgi:glycosyltransferase involved in cell wall biosynthesis